MIVVIQRVERAEVQVAPDGPTPTSRGIDEGLLVLCGFELGDTSPDVAWVAHKLLSLRVFEDSDGRMNESLEARTRGLLVVPNFTLAGDCRKGRRPSFDRAMPPESAAPRFEEFVDLLRAGPSRVEAGEFGAHMHVSLVNDGPITLLLNSADRPRRSS
ncbi:MAG: D-aminoacyl-tRNA deacylase [Planctomycetota bacterium]